MLGGLIGFPAMLLLLNFSAKSYKKHLLKRPVKPGDYLAEMVIIAFWIIGIWIIQPKLNQIIKGNKP
ncbi:hypothetical protein ACE1ET_05650 [Saccharicrinis sp. FJH62]|uniref:hypothetical protein n=1 Tax=Saccharicrinis sp. FJH62 TaxID=3344657 RepID=UPI0035D50D03